ncbi:FMN-binding protein [Actinoallomurus sp. NPDC050550]|uniref:FMN-binding protein n=1 Tax=Actinoallomurus sp. NPDC050550 TaxID=3154937 RepID=UPI0033F14D79
MIKVAVSLVSTAVGLVLLLSFKSHTAGAPKSALAGAGAGPTPAPTASLGGHDGTSPSPPKRPKRPAGKSGTFTGDPIDTPYGTMQVAAVIANSKLTSVKVLRHTDVGGRSAQIDAAALPVLKSEAMSARSANIDVVSGATYTSRGYARSLQSALDKAGI